MKDFPTKIQLLLLVLAILVAVFYWYEYRPYSVTKSCYGDKQRFDSGFSMLERGGRIAPQDYQTEFQKCLNSHGLR